MFAVGRHSTYPLVICYIAIENGISMAIFNSYVTNHQRVLRFKKGQCAAIICDNSYRLVYSIHLLVVTFNNIPFTTNYCYYVRTGQKKVLTMNC